ncbi:hypothetical protein OF117_19400 [Geodermatophilus sp. YIM 151500]|uniref:hypothetical protein n=1 Tax=Geodermatophilus sp. YIM 151500 TaxID=2984531 RepID=UPI0021E3FE22|nr:hypothetical protein [Geodermatophilus sp. YIM 151500]MCV2491516.1 hypothetical protein [Geodermatophilus sp. YIM 151500]
MNPPDAAEGARRAADLLRLLERGETTAAAELLAQLTDVRELVFLGAGLTAVARTEGRRLPPAQRAQASTRQVRLGQLRDANRQDPGGLRTWLQRSAEEVLFLRALTARAS